jgi:hypothetical protein
MTTPDWDELTFGSRAQVPVPARDPDVLVDALESDGTPAVERRAGESVPHAPGGGR